MRILHLLAGLSEASGVANIARRFVRVQRERGDEAELLAPAVKWNPVFFGLAFALEAARKARTADEIWVHCSWTFPVWFGAWLARRYGRRLVVVPEGSFDPKRLRNHAGWKKRLVAPLDRRVLRAADEVLALCRDEIGWVKAFEPSAKVGLGRVPVFFDAGPGSVPDDSASVGMGTDPLRVLFLGRAEDPLKGVRFLKRVEEDGRRSGDLPLEVHYVSGKFGDELEKEWAWCDILCLPTLSDNFGLVVAEALEHGKRVITTDGAPAWAEYFRKNPRRGVFISGFRDGTDETRVAALTSAFRSLASPARRLFP